MQWLIDIIQEWIQIRGNLPPIFVGRGDAANRDFGVAQLTTDFAWHDLDLSAIVPEHATGVCLRVTCVSDPAYAKIIFRKKSNVNEWNVSRLYTQVAFFAISKDCTVALDADRIIQYKAENVGWIVIDIVVKNWWF